MPSAAAAAATIRPSPRTMVAGPGQLGSARGSDGGRTSTRVCSTATARPTSAKPQASVAIGRDTRRTRPPSASATMPAVNHTGTVPGPPGLISDTCHGTRSGLVGPGSPACNSHDDGCRSRSMLQGRSSASGTSTSASSRSLTAPARKSNGMSAVSAPPVAGSKTCRRPGLPSSPTPASTSPGSTTPSAARAGSAEAPTSATSTRTTAMTQLSGTNAVMTARRRAPPHTARHDTAERRATLISAGSRIRKTTVPIRPVATAPMAAGSRA